MTDVKENPYEGPNAEGNIERDLASFKAVSGMSTATEYLINMITALKNARAQVADLEKTERAYAILCKDYGDACHERDELEKNYAEFMNDCHDEHHKHVAFRDQSARIATLEKELARMSLAHDAVAQHRDICNDAVKERDVKLVAATEALEKANRIRSNACVAVVIAQEWIAEKDARIATLKAELAAAKATAQHWQGIAEQRRERADADLARITGDVKEAETSATEWGARWKADVEERDVCIAALETELATAKMRYDELHDQRHAEARKADALAADLAATKKDE